MDGKLFLNQEEKEKDILGPEKDQKPPTSITFGRSFLEFCCSTLTRMVKRFVTPKFLAPFQVAKE